MARVHQAAVLALSAALALTLQGCDMGGGSCSAVEFEGGTVAAGSRDQDGAVTCTDGGDYAGPELSCNWVGVACTEAGEDGVRTCGVNYAFGVKGDGLEEWPASKKAETAASKDDLPAKQFETDAADAAFAAKATEAAGQSLSKKLMAAADKAKAHLADAKEKASSMAAAAKEKGSAAMDKAKKSMGKGDDDAKGEDAKDDAKEEEKRRLGEAKAIDPKELKCSAKADAKADAKGDAKDDAKGDAKSDAKDDAKGDAKDAEKLFSVSGQRMSKSPSDVSSGWAMPLAGCLAVAGVAFAALKVARGRSARSRVLDTRQQDEESSQEAIE